MDKSKALNEIVKAIGEASENGLDGQTACSQVTQILTEFEGSVVKKYESMHNVSGSLGDKAQIINALTNTMAVNKKELGGYHSLRDNSLEKLDKLIKSIDI